MENQQANHRKIKVVIGILAAILAAVLLYWLFNSLISMNQHNQTNQGRLEMASRLSEITILIITAK